MKAGRIDPGQLRRSPVEFAPSGTGDCPSSRPESAQKRPYGAGRIQSAVRLSEMDGTSAGSQRGVWTCLDHYPACLRDEANWNGPAWLGAASLPALVPVRGSEPPFRPAPTCLLKNLFAPFRLSLRSGIQGCRGGAGGAGGLPRPAKESPRKRRPCQCRVSNSQCRVSVSRVASATLTPDTDTRGL